MRVRRRKLKRSLSSSLRNTHLISYLHKQSENREKTFFINSSAFKRWGINRFPRSRFNYNFSVPFISALSVKRNTYINVLFNYINKPDAMSVDRETIDQNINTVEI